jgi:hypothetical protein
MSRDARKSGLAMFRLTMQELTNIEQFCQKNQNSKKSKLNILQKL